MKGGGGVDGQDVIGESLIRIAECLERIEKALPGCNQEALHEALIAELSSSRTPVRYK